MDDCIFCKIVKGNAPCTVVFENEHVLAFMDIFPAANGHTLVVPKKHFVNTLDCPEKELSEVIMAVKKIGQAQVKGLGAHGFNIHQSNNREAGQIVFHLHFHVIPRFAGDGLSFRWQPQKVETKELEKSAEKIRKGI